MKTKLCSFQVLLFSLLLLNIQAQNSSFDWAKSMGTINQDSPLDITTDIAGNVLSTGYFRDGIIDLDPGLGVNNFTSKGKRDIYIQKLDPQGNLIWAKTIGGSSLTAPGSDQGKSIITDQSNNIYITGIFSDTVDFDPGVGTYNKIASSGSSSADFFLLKLDANGNFIWVKTFISNNYQSGTTMASDQNSNIYLAGTFAGNTNFDPGNSNITYSSVGNGLASDIFVLKLDSTGVIKWVKQIGDIKTENVYSISTNGINVLISGGYSGTIDFDPSSSIHNLTSKSTAIRDCFILNLDVNGNFIWVKGIEGYNTYGYSIKVNAASVYVTGSFFDTVDFDPSPNIHQLITNHYRSDLYILKLDLSGTFQWVKQIGGANDDWSFDLALDASENIYITGDFVFDSVDFDPATSSYIVSGTGLFIEKFDSNGNFLFVKTFSSMVIGAIDSRGLSISVDKNNNIITTGTFGGSTLGPIDFNPDVNATFNMTSNGAYDIFILKLSQGNATQILESVEMDEFLFYPNPSTSSFNIVFSDIKSTVNVDVYDVRGKLIESGGVKNVSTIYKNFTNQPDGIYFIKIYNADFNKTVKWVKAQ